VRPVAKALIQVRLAVSVNLEEKLEQHYTRTMEMSINSGRMGPKTLIPGSWVT